MEALYESTLLNDFNSTKSNGTRGTETTNNNNDKAVAAANLIKTLDTALSEMSCLSTSAARNAEDARRTAREASEVARRYTARSYVSSTPTSTNHQNGFSERNPEKEKKQHAMDEKRHESSSERLARSHAQDVLALSLELERTKQALQQECMAHDATRSNLSQARAEHTSLTTQLEQVQEQHKSALEKKEQEIAQLQKEVLKAQDEKKAAEDDAQLALDLAMGNAESREQLESWLERALQEVQLLRGQLTSHCLYPGAGATTTILATNTEMTTECRAPQQQEYSSSSKEESTTTTRRSVRFAESPTVLNGKRDEDDNADDTNTTSTASPRRLVASRSMVAAGRHLLHRATDSHKDDDEISKAPLRSAQRLRQRLLALNNKDNNGTSSHAMVVSSHSKCATITSVIPGLQSCASRLGIQMTMPRNNDDHAQVESMTRQFCNAVESKLNQQKEDIQELQALCEYLENKLLLGNDDDGS